MPGRLLGTEEMSRVFLITTVNGERQELEMIRGGWGSHEIRLMMPKEPAILQYFFTKERVSEDAAVSDVKPVPLIKQIRTCFSDKYWLCYFAIFFLYQIGGGLYSNSVNFYANYVVGTYNDGVTLTLLMLGQATTILGIFLLWPLVQKFGKRWIFFAGMLIAGASSIVIFLAPTQIPVVFSALMVKSVGLVPTYLFAGMMADAMDHIEWKNGYRCDGFTATMNSVMLTLVGGVATTIFNAGLRPGKAGGYLEPLTGSSLADLFETIKANGWTAQLPMDSYTANASGAFTVGLAQNASTVNWLILCFSVLPAVIYFLCALIGFFNDVGDKIPRIARDIEDRYRREAEARGEVYVSPEEKAALEQEENDRIAEENRIAELKARCKKKGLNFEEEEARYQAKLAAQKAKEEAKAARKGNKGGQA